jgi:cell division protein FtsX
MKRLLAVVVVLALLVIGVGFYRGWFAVSQTDPETGGNKVNVNLTVDKDKMQEDAEAVKKQAAELSENVTGGDEPAPNEAQPVEP